MKTLYKQFMIGFPLKDSIACQTMIPELTTKCVFGCDGDPFTVWRAIYISEGEGSRIVECIQIEL